jgi:hypothetical protein
MMNQYKKKRLIWANTKMSSVEKDSLDIKTEDFFILFYGELLGERVTVIDGDHRLLQL